MLIQIKEENDILLMYQMTEPCTKITKHGLQSFFLIGLALVNFRIDSVGVECITVRGWVRCHMREKREEWGLGHA